MLILAERCIQTARRSFPFILTFILLCAGTVLAAESELCSKLDRLGDRVACETSDKCMSVKDPDGGAGAYRCVPAANACQDGFRQMRLLDGGLQRDPTYDAASACEANKACRFVPAGQCYCPPLVDCVCGGGTPPNCVPRG